MKRPETYDFARPEDDWAARAARKRYAPVRGLPELKRLLFKLRYALFSDIQTWRIWPTRIRAIFLRAMGMRLSQETYVAENVYFAGIGLVTEGKAVIGAGSHIEADAEIRFEPGVGLGFGVMILTSTHEFGDASWRAGPIDRLPVRIGAGCWIGSRATILPGVTVAPGCVVAAGALVTKDTEPKGIYAGVPAKRIRDVTH